jgi:hypothetical protein
MDLDIEKRTQKMDNMQTELRKHQHTLAVVGMGAIGFGIWSVVKAILYLTIINPLKDTVLADYENITDLEYEYLIALGVTIFITILIVLIDLLLRWRVGKLALDIARGNRLPTARFFVRTGFVILVDALELVMGFLGIIGVISSEEELLDSVSTLLVDLTSVVTLIDMVVAAVMIRKITEQLETGQNTLQQSTEIQN